MSISAMVLNVQMLSPAAFQWYAYRGVRFLCSLPNNPKAYTMNRVRLAQY